MGNLALEFHRKHLSDFDLLRIFRAQMQGFNRPVTAYLSHVFLAQNTAVGVVFGHTNKGPSGRYDDGHYIRTSSIVSVQREGRFFVITTLNSRYVIATFRRDIGRQTLREFQTGNTTHLPL